MRKKVIAGNWKMNLNLSDSIKLVSQIKNGLSENDNVDVIVCPPFTSLETVYTLVKDSPVKLGAQNVHFEKSGAFTGEISTEMLKSVGCEYAIVGHSERRTIFNESDETINKKNKAVLSDGLKLIFCVGETLDEREKGITQKVIETQIKGGLAGINENDLKNIIIAYEPVWAIGTGKTASPEQAQEIHKFIRSLIEKLYSASASNDLVIQYGGSVKPNNAVELLSQEDIDGALVGGACLDSASFLEIIKAAY
ncbi:MAG: triose-phosphate isomerase [Bacteroidetes bacterium]|nr:triose-phosphate isomerase [Bacteroidota bacterium]MBU1680289.1 triose-phosphate isomerase [Bacteroidota bacterium]